MDAKASTSPYEAYSAYLPYIRQRWLTQQVAWQRRQQEAWTAARQVAGILYRQFGAGQVIAFGSLVHPGRFGDHSDLDLAVAGIPPARFFRAWATAGAASPFELDLVDLADCAPTLRDRIEQEGVLL